jgi:hypothetical protein
MHSEETNVAVDKPVAVEDPTTNELALQIALKTVDLCNRKSIYYSAIALLASMPKQTVQEIPGHERKLMDEWVTEVLNRGGQEAENLRTRFGITPEFFQTKGSLRGDTQG